MFNTFRRQGRHPLCVTCLSTTTTPPPAVDAHPFEFPPDENPFEFSEAENYVPAPEPDSQARTFWLSIPAHPLWKEMKLEKQIKDFINSEQSIMLWTLPNQELRRHQQPDFPLPQVRISWNNPGKHLFLRLRNLG